MKGALAGAAIVLIIGTFLAGYWPQHGQLVDAQARIAMLETDLADAQDRVRLGEVLGRLLRLREALGAQNFGQAAGLSSAFFDAVRDEAARAKRPEVKQVLETLQRSRDGVTTSIARTDGAVQSVIAAQEVTLRQALGYPVGAEPAK